eukprot:755348-Hanusia_phi.AAC.6
MPSVWRWFHAGRGLLGVALVLQFLLSAQGSPVTCSSCRRADPIFGEAMQQVSGAGWKRKLCSDCADRISLQEDVTLLRLTRRCLDCTKFASFANPSWDSVPVHCKSHKRAAEMVRRSARCFRSFAQPLFRMLLTSHSYAEQPAAAVRDFGARSTGRESVSIRFTANVSGQDAADVGGEKEEEMDEQERRGYEQAGECEVGEPGEGRGWRGGGGGKREEGDGGGGRGGVCDVRMPSYSQNSANGSTTLLCKRHLQVNLLSLRPALLTNFAAEIEGADNELLLGRMIRGRGHGMEKTQCEARQWIEECSCLIGLACCSGSEI